MRREEPKELLLREEEVKRMESIKDGRLAQDAHSQRHVLPAVVDGPAPGMDTHQGSNPGPWIRPESFLSWIPRSPAGGDKHCHGENLTNPPPTGANC